MLKVSIANNLKALKVSLEELHTFESSLFTTLIVLDTGEHILGVLLQTLNIPLRQGLRFSVLVRENE